MRGLSSLNLSPVSTSLADHYSSCEMSFTKSACLSLVSVLPLDSAEVRHRHGITGAATDSADRLKTCVNPPQDIQDINRQRRVSLTMRVVSKSRKLI